MPVHAADDARLAALSVSVRAVRSHCFIDKIEVTGLLVPREQVDVGVEREGLKVAQILAQPLDTVAAGQTLARLVPLEGAEGGGLTLQAPVSGTVLRSQGAVGQPISPRQGPMFQLIGRGEIDLVAEAALSDLQRIQEGQSVAVRPLGAAEIAGKVRRVEPGVEAADQVGRVRIDLGANPEARVGTYARGIVTVGRRCGVAIPYSAVQYEADGAIAHVVNNARIETRQVTVGILEGGQAEIRSGLSEADRIAVRAGPFLRDGDVVRPIPVEDGPR